jgi:hypothetical protein
MEAKYILCNTVVSNDVWIKHSVKSLNFRMQDGPINVFCDNKFAISLIKSGAQSFKDKHINISYHYIQDMIEKGEIEIEFIPSIEMVADPMMKGLTLDKFREHVAKIELRKI